MVIFGDDNGSCSLYNMTGAEYDEWSDKLADAEDDDQEEALLSQLKEKEIEITELEVGYVPEYVMQLAKIYGFEARSN